VLSASIHQGRPLRRGGASTAPAGAFESRFAGGGRHATIPRPVMDDACRLHQPTDRLPMKKLLSKALRAAVLLCFLVGLPLAAVTGQRLPKLSALLALLPGGSSPEVVEHAPPSRPPRVANADARPQLGLARTLAETVATNRVGRQHPAAEPGAAPFTPRGAPAHGRRAASSNAVVRTDDRRLSSPVSGSTQGAAPAVVRGEQPSRSPQFDPPRMAREFQAAASGRAAIVPPHVRPATYRVEKPRRAGAPRTQPTDFPRVWPTVESPRPTRR